MTTLFGNSRALLLVIYFVACIVSVPALALFQGAPREGAPSEGIAWPKNDLGETVIPVCFRRRGTPFEEPRPDDDSDYFPVYGISEWLAKRALVMDALQDSWQKWSNIRFDDLGYCPGKEEELRGYLYFDLINYDCGGCGNAIPRGYHAEGVRAWFMMENDDEKLIRTVVIHEIGHALGFRHEMDRPDAYFAIPSEPLSGICGDQANPAPASPCCRVESNGTILSKQYDDVSIMNYCAPRNRNGLSAGDIEGVQELYGTSRTSGWLKVLPSLNLYAM